MPSGPRHHHAAIIMLLHCCAPEQRQASGARPPVLTSLLSRTVRRQGKARQGSTASVPLKLDSEPLRFAGSLCASRPSESPSAHSKHPLSTPRLSSPRKQTGRPATVSRTGQDPSQTPKGLSNSKRNAHPSLNNLARRASLLFHALHREIALPTGLERQGEPHRSVSHSQSLTSISCAGFLVERRLLLLLAAPIPCHAMPLTDADD